MKTMKRAALAVLAFALATSTPAIAAIYKCDVGGKTVFQDMPCTKGPGGEMRVTAPGVKVPTPPPAAAAEMPAQPAPGAPAEIDRTKAWLEQSEKERKTRQLDREIQLAEYDRDDLQKRMDGELAGLRAKKGAAMNNFAGATWENSISTEMQAVTQKYDIQIRAAEAKIADLKTKRAALQ